MGIRRDMYVCIVGGTWINNSIHIPSYRSLEYIMHNILQKVGLRKWRGREAKEPGTGVEGYVCPVAVPKQSPS